MSELLTIVVSKGFAVHGIIAIRTGGEGKGRTQENPSSINKTGKLRTENDTLGTYTI
jgi:hypothetical protein